MQLTDYRDIEASPQDVWAAILDADVLKACIPGCEELTGSAEDGFEAVVVQKVGPVRAKFTGEIELSDIVEGVSYRISGKGAGGAAGGASGGAAVSLSDEEGGTKLTYEAEAKVTGKIAQLGGRLIDGFAKKMADQFFTRFQEEVEGPAVQETETADAAAEGDEGEKKGLWKRLTGS